MAKLEATLRVAKPYAPHQPWPTQLHFLSLDCEEALYGGAAGGGKSDTGLFGALQYVDQGEYSAGIFRRNKTDLYKPGSILDRATRWFSGTAAQWDDKLHGFRFPSGATIHFGYGPNFASLERAYQGTEFHYVFIDELTQWAEPLYRYLFSRLRRSSSTRIPVRMRGGSNPGGSGHAWVKRRFVENARHVVRGSPARADIAARRNKQPMPEPRLYESPASDQAKELARELGLKAQGAFFVPAFKEDNPGLDLVDYRQKLARLDTTTRAQLDGGDWDAVAGGKFFQHGWFHFAKEAPRGLRWVRSWDLAATKEEANKDPDWTAGGLVALEEQSNEDKRPWCAHMVHFQEDPGETERRVQLTAKGDGHDVVQLFEQEPGAAGKSQARGMKARVLVGHTVRTFPRSGAKETYWSVVSSLASATGLWLVEGPWNQALIDELTSIPIGHDDQADCLAWGVDRISHGFTKPEIPEHPQRPRASRGSLFNEQL